LRRTRSDGSDYRVVSPRGYVPLLEFDDGSRHTEAAALLQAVADMEPAQRLVGAPGSTRRLAVVEWVAFVATELHKAFSPWLWHKDTAPSTRDAVKAKLAERFAELDRHLATREYLAGDFSIADAYAYTIVNWATLLGLSLRSTPHLQAYLARVASRPQVQEALRAEGLLT
jgi:glutathione S-transferase